VYFGEIFGDFIKLWKMWKIVENSGIKIPAKNLGNFSKPPIPLALLLLLLFINYA